MPYIRERNIITTETDAEIKVIQEDENSNYINSKDSDTSLTIDSNLENNKEEEQSLVKINEDILTNKLKTQSFTEKGIEFEKKESKVKLSLYTTELYLEKFKIDDFILYKEEIYQIKTIDKLLARWGYYRPVMPEGSAVTEKELVELIQAYGQSEVFKRYLRDLCASDIRLYFQATTDMERHMFRGAWKRTNHFITLIQKSNDKCFSFLHQSNCFCFSILISLLKYDFGFLISKETWI